MYVVDSDEAVGEHQHRVGHVGAVLVGGAAVSLQLISEVANEAAEQVGRRAARPLDRARRELTVEQVEDRTALLRLAGGVAHAHGARIDVVAEHAALRPGAGAEVGAARQPRRGVGAVEPEGVLGGAEEPFEESLGRGLAGQGAGAQLGVRGARPRRARATAGRGQRLAPWRGRARRLAALGELVEVAHQCRAVRRRHRLGVELDAPQRPAPVFDPHHDAVVGPGADVAVGAHAGDRQRVVADHREALRDVGEEAAAFVVDLADPAVHRLRRALHFSVEHLAEPLVTEADAEHRDLAEAQDVVADAEVVPAARRPRPGREHDRVEVPAFQRPPGDRVVVDDDRLLAGDPRQQVEDVVGVGVVVVDQERPHRPDTCFRCAFAAHIVEKAHRSVIGPSPGRGRGRPGRAPPG